MLSAAGTRESSMSKAGLDKSPPQPGWRNQRQTWKHSSARCERFTDRVSQPANPDTEKLSEVLLKLNETSLSQLRRDHETGHLEHKIANASK
jgi:hypothetical protein